MRYTLISILCIVLCNAAYAQQDYKKKDTTRHKNEWLEKRDYPLRDSVRRELETIPPFSIYKDNYFVTGTNFDGGVNQNNSDAKFQISIMHRLIKGVLPHDMYLFITYTQKSFWDIYRKSAPFEDSNYNPSIGIGNNIVVDDRVLGVGFLQIEHESNGLDSIWNRSWNRVSFTAIYMVNRNFNVQFKAWIPFWKAKENKDITRYAGYWHVAGNFRTQNQRFSFSSVITKRGGWDLNANVFLEAAFRMTKKSNQYICLQYYNGYAEGLLDYNRFQSYLRFGILIKPNKWVSIY